jgi:solute carrier family 35 (UDP-sugar transporter), member A1/2/3
LLELLVGLSAVTVACFSSALAGVYFEMVLKVPSSSDATKHPPASLWMRNIQLSFFSIVIAVAQGMKGTSSTTTQSYFYGFNAWVWILVILQACGCLLGAAVFKYADNVLKGLATGVSVVFATALSMILFGTPLSNQFTASVNSSGIYYFSNQLPASLNNLFASVSGSSTGKDKSERQDNIETKNLLPK